MLRHPAFKRRGFFGVLSVVLCFFILFAGGCQPAAPSISPSFTQATATTAAATRKPGYIKGILQTDRTDSDRPPQSGETRLPVQKQSGQADEALLEKGIAYFGIIASGTEFGEAASGYVRKWTKPFTVVIKGSPTPEDRAVLQNLIGQINSLQLVPQITLLADAAESADCTVYIDSLTRLAAELPEYRDDNYGMFFFEENNFVIRRSAIAVATGVTDQTERNHLIQEEFLQSLGLGNDSGLYRDSIFQEEWTSVQRPSELDWLVLEMLYQPEIRPGQSIKEAQETLRELYLPKSSGRDRSVRDERF